ncbi:MAG: hypothetical protein C4555_05985 [Dehalococcoidia bacterium]|nr:MAG: hypothetical protein C4555_05985 [Dehalococcoidia bacterium]
MKKTAFLTESTEDISINQTQVSLQGISSYAQGWRNKNGEFLNNPTFLVHNRVNVSRVKPLISKEDRAEFAAHKERLKSKGVVLAKYDSKKPFPDYMVVRAAEKSRYFAGGRKLMQRNIRKRLGSRWFSDGVLMTLTYDPKRYTKEEAWRDCNVHLRKLMHTLNTRRFRVEKNSYKYLKAVEEIPEYHFEDANGRKCDAHKKGSHRVRNEAFGYPHLHVFFPGLQFLVRAEDEMSVLWKYGRSGLENKNRVNVASYCCKYVSKLEGWTEESQSYLWYYKKRVYSYSQCYRLPEFVKESPAGEWAFKGVVLFDALKACTYTAPDGKVRFKASLLGGGVVEELSEGMLRCVN